MRSAQVELINNPYRQRLKVLINGEAVSVYSSLEQYMDEPFCYWCDKILDSIYEECNGEDFQLHFSSREEEMEIMKKIAEKNIHCTQYSSSPLARPISLQERIRKLNLLLKETYGIGYRTFEKNILFLIPESLQKIKDDLLGLDVRNSFCQINTQVIYYSDYVNSKPTSDVTILIGEEENTEKYIECFGISDGFVIELGKNKEFKKKINGLFLYESTEEFLFETIFDCLLLSPLLDMFCSCINTLSADVKEKSRDELEELQSTDIRIFPVPESTVIEEGTSKRIQFGTDIEGYMLQSTDLHFTYSEKGVIHCNGLLVEGLKEGKATLNVFREGELVPCANVDFTVIKRNRIKELKLDEDNLILGEGDCVKLNLIYLPENADNVDKIEWETDNEQIVSVDQRGNIQAKSKGSCTIWCYAEKVSVCCRCCVKPHLKEIKIESQELYLIYGQEEEIKVKLMPENCIDNQIVISSMDMRTVNVINGKLKAVGIGETRVIIQNREETVRAEVKVHVMTEKEYKKMQKRQKNYQSTTLKKKEGWLSKLLG